MKSRTSDASRPATLIEAMSAADFSEIDIARGFARRGVLRL
jgi:hypothetical protein